jgi:hypothetical protein
MLVLVENEQGLRETLSDIEKALRFRATAQLGEINQVREAGQEPSVDALAFVNMRVNNANVIARIMDELTTFDTEKQFLLFTSTEPIPVPIGDDEGGTPGLDGIITGD